MNWERGWAILASMQGLRNLHVVITDPSPQHMWESNWLQLETLLLEPVRKVILPRQFELVLPYVGCDVKKNMGESRVRLRGPEEDPRLEEDV
jgi:hypothetical protein